MDLYQRQINENHHNAVRMIFLKLCQSMYWLSLALYTIYTFSIYRVGLINLGKSPLETDVVSNFT